jgi:hypothetical protein
MYGGRCREWVWMCAVTLGLTFAPVAVAASPEPDPAPSVSVPQPDAPPGASSSPARDIQPPTTVTAPTVTVRTAPEPSASPPSEPAPSEPAPSTPAPATSAPAIAPAPPAAGTTTRDAKPRRSQRAEGKRARARAQARAKAQARARADRRRAEQARAAALAAPPEFSAAVVPLEAAQEQTPDTALIGAALGLCALALVGAGVVARARREAGIV